MLWREKGESARAVAERLGVSRRTIFNWGARCQARHEVDSPRRRGAGPRSGRPRTADEISDPLLERRIDHDPRPLGDRPTVGTAPLWRQYLEEEQGIKGSRQSGSVARARLRLRWQRPRPQ